MLYISRKLKKYNTVLNVKSAYELNLTIMDLNPSRFNNKKYYISNLSKIFYVLPVW